MLFLFVSGGDQRSVAGNIYACECASVYAVNEIHIYMKTS